MSEDYDDASDHYAAEIAELRGLLMSAKRYVDGYAENDRNHPQAREGARNLSAQIAEALS